MTATVSSAGRGCLNEGLIIKAMELMLILDLGNVKGPE